MFLIRMVGESNRDFEIFLFDRNGRELGCRLSTMLYQPWYGNPNDEGDDGGPETSDED